ncbi:CPBP family intramembrane metalloprotease [Kriegella sp. EG-1]|nr:CPBP family intramembrane metalloprotease [Flavobacteriaceae bacterium EG-1]
MYIEQAYKGLSESWRYMVGLVTIFIMWQVIGGFPLLIAVLLKSNSMNALAGGDIKEIAIILGSNSFLFYMLLSFVIGLVSLFIFVKFVHKRSITSLTTSRSKIDWKRIFFAFIVWGIISGGFVIIDVFLAPNDYIWNFDFDKFIILAVIAILMIPIQTSMEEYYMRGYLMQCIGVVAKNKWAPLVITSVLFGVMHLFNPEVEKLGYGIMVYYIGTGFFLGLLVLMDEGLELALGFHAANNLITALLVTADWTAFQTNSVYRDVSEPALSWDVFVPVLIIYPILIFIFSKKYGWSNWRERLAGKVYSKEEFLALEQNNGEIQNPA